MTGIIAINNRIAFTVYCIIIVGLFSPFILLGEVATPHRLYEEIGAVDPNANFNIIENRKFSDFTNSYIPEINEHLKGTRYGWLTLWTNYNELGRPVYQISGFSPAYLPSWIIARFTDNPWRFITALSIFACFFAGVFFILFCREKRLNPLAGLIGGSCLASSPLFMYWLTFPMFPAVWCWATGALWTLTRLAQKPDLIGWSVLAFSVYSSLMTAYPQSVVFQAYLLGGYFFYLIFQKRRSEIRDIGRFVAIVASALIVGVAFSLPAYMDLAYLSAESARSTPNASFFKMYLPKIHTMIDVIRFIALSTVPELFGNPVSPQFPFPYDGLSITPIFIFFTVFAFLTVYKQTWGWWFAILVFSLFTFIPPLYTFGVKYLWFNLSPINPLGGIILPLSAIVAYGTDALLKPMLPNQFSNMVWAAVGSVVLAIGIGVAFGLYQKVTIRWSFVIAMLMIVGLIAFQHQQTRPVLLIAAMISAIAIISFPLMLHQNSEQIAITSPLVEKVRANLPTGSRFAVAAPGISVLPPNLNAILGLNSLHSYNSLSSRRFHKLINALSGEMKTYGRWNEAISPNYDSAIFWMSNIGLILSPTKLSHANLEYLGQASNIHLHRVISRMGEALQVIIPHDNMKIDNLHIADPRLCQRFMAACKSLDKGDFLELEVTSGAPSVLVLSQKFHRDWIARALVQSRWEPVTTAAVNDVFQGILLPKGVHRVQLKFRPWIRYCWITHLFWLVLMIYMGLLMWWRTHDIRK